MNLILSLLTLSTAFLVLFIILLVVNFADYLLERLINKIYVK
jgi:hypothetical protein